MQYFIKTLLALGEMRSCTNQRGLAPETDIKSVQHYGVCTCTSMY